MTSQKKLLPLAVLLAALTLSLAHAAPPPAPAASAVAEPIYGSQLMTDQERSVFRARMWAAKTPEERERIRAEHHAEMQKRAQERGITLPETPPPRPGAGPMGGPMGAGPGRRSMGPGPCAASAPGAGCPSQPRHRMYRRQRMAPASTPQ
jgi:hypothetical protein